ncbi:MAG: peptidyl-prolyl cis-trans isomerase, partial [Candidatus Omnitrophica bacterium]|nr:peptidyl-prolyl cis-trans isomerase [Candidatus Omnitrophota bacterium]
LVEPPGFHLREIVVETQAEANELLTELLGGADFAEVAKEKSISSSSANGGDIGFIRQIPFPEMAEIVAALSEGEVSEVVKGPDGFYIVKLEEKSKERSLPLEEIKEDLKANILLSKQQETIIEHINKLKDQFTVEVNEKLLK